MDELHRVVVDALVLADAEHRNDVGVVQPCRRPSLAAKALQVRRREQVVGGQHLQSDVPAQRLLHGFVNNAHAAAGYFAQDPVLAELL